ncbi:hypothetical protein AT15_07515 [Kosmotoga arenicorallina S304]|uniref:Uncharacterized protein n=1 Tax=Kosmotoga arenicorallina S304 TaxID=1453497 RepID=A0A176K2A2_9BACT|nr:DUF881 domain-containing protein [Kosmotoga arenicorallina]OAA31336.1 hypothetical protein AT15_07515 [Kosmotoga arenicorallina S304]
MKYIKGIFILEIFIAVLLLFVFLSHYPIYFGHNGTGVRLMVASAGEGFGVIHDTDILRIINELYALGLKNFSINGIKIDPYTFVRCVGPSITINNREIVPDPLKIEIIGDPDYILSGLSILIEHLKSCGFSVSALSLEKIVIP